MTRRNCPPHFKGRETEVESDKVKNDLPKVIWGVRERERTEIYSHKEKTRGSFTSRASEKITIPADTWVAAW